MRNKLTYALVTGALLVAVAMPLAAAAPSIAPPANVPPNAAYSLDCLDAACTQVVVPRDLLAHFQAQNQLLANEGEDMRRLIAASAYKIAQLQAELVRAPRRCGTLEVLPQRKTSWNPA